MNHVMSEVKSWLEHLGYLVPCRGVLVAGSGFGSWVEELNALNVPRALFVEGQNSKIERMKKLYDLPQNCQVVQGILWIEEAEVRFYEASNSALSGLVAPDTFREIWPNATTLNVESFHATTLKNVVEEYDPESSINWLIVDCFPAVKILQGALERLDQYDVVLARTVIDENFVDTLGLQRKELHTFLEDQGFRQIVTFEETSPSVGLVLYVRDVNMILKKELETKADELQTIQTEKGEQRVALENELAQIKQESEAKADELKHHQTKQEEHKEQVEKLNLENEQMKQECDELSMQKIQLTANRKQLEQKNETLLKEIDAVRKERDSIKEEKKYSGDAKVDEFMNDIAPFFSQKAITYVDVGAFIGEVFMKMNDLKKINIREAHLFEPNPSSYKQLLKNIETYHTSSLHSYNIGVGKEKTKALFSSAKSMTKQSTAPIDVSKSFNTFECNIVPLNDFFATITEGHIHLLKVDVEGNELNVFAGASEFLQSQKIDMIYLEVGFNKNGTQQTYFCAIDECLQSHGYHVFKFYEQTKEWIEDSPVLRRCNVAYISNKFADANPYKLTLENNRLKKELDSLQKKIGSNK
jgi:FkbM family methyltransferase